jgi:uncharacterized membrane protein
MAPTAGVLGGATSEHPHRDDHVRTDPLRHRHDTPGFSRVTSLSDGVFAIAMTLLVLTLHTPGPGTVGAATTLADQLPQLVTVVLAFALVANLWWQHHELFSRLAVVEPGLVGTNLALLGAVALVPFPTSLVGDAPTDRVAVIAFIAVFTALSLLFLLLVLRARRTGAWRDEVTDAATYLMIGRWVSGIVVLLVAALLTLWHPVAGLSALALSIILGPVAARRGTAADRLQHRLER